LAEKISRQIEMDRKAEGSEMRQNVVTNSSNEKNPKQNKNQMLPKTFKPERTSSHINQSNQDHMCTYATEDTTLPRSFASFSEVVSLSSSIMLSELSEPLHENVCGVSSTL
jgi:hypothetical protein